MAGRSAPPNPPAIAEQADVIALLANPATYGLPSVERVDTHVSHIFIAGPTTYKLKRAVKLNFLDFSTVEKRRSACERELAVNRAIAAEIYHRVLPITRENEGLKLGGSGAPVDWLVEMATFDRSLEFDRLADAGLLADADIARLADVVVEMHRNAEPKRRCGGADAMLTTGRQVADAIVSAEIGDQLRTKLQRWRSEIDAQLSLLRRRLDVRRRHGLVRRCHGDLHLGNIVRFQGETMPFDAIEFSEEIASIDVLYDVAFPAMDLLHREEVGLAALLVSRYLNQSRDYSGLALMPAFISLRAAIRALAAVHSSAVDGAQRAESLVDFALAVFASQPPPQLLAIGGFSGSGKSTLARTLAPKLPGAVGGVVIRSDICRKRCFGVGLHDRLPPEAYESNVTARVYEIMRRDAARALRAGASVILDATFSNDRERAAIDALADRLSVRCIGLWLDGDVAELKRRIEARGPDASDATADVVDQQWRDTRGAVALSDRWRVLEATHAPVDVAARAIQLLAKHMPERRDSELEHRT